jgi:hypothetical protein
MLIDDILSLLEAERDKLNRAIEALQGPTKRRGRPPKNALLTIPVTGGDARPKRQFSAAARRKMAAAQRRRWAAAKSAEETEIPISVPATKKASKARARKTWKASSARVSRKATMEGAARKAEKTPASAKAGVATQLPAAP